MSGAAALSAARNRRSNSAGPSAPVAKKNIPGQSSCSVRPPPPRAQQQLQQQQQAQQQQQQAQQQQAQQQQQQRQVQPSGFVPALHPLQILKLHDTRLNKLEQTQTQTQPTGAVEEQLQLHANQMQTALEQFNKALSAQAQIIAAQAQLIAAAASKITALEKNLQVVTDDMTSWSEFVTVLDNNFKVFQDSSTEDLPVSVQEVSTSNSTSTSLCIVSEEEESEQE